MLKTYYVSGMMEWVAVIPTPCNNMRIHFSGGALSGYGVTPATYSTDNPAIQHLIENSDFFRSGRIRLSGGNRFKESFSEEKETVIKKKK